MCNIFKTDVWGLKKTCAINRFQTLLTTSKKPLRFFFQNNKPIQLFTLLIYQVNQIRYERRFIKT